MTSIDDQPKPRGLKRLSLTPGAPVLAPVPRPPLSAGLSAESPIPSPVGHGKRYAPKRMSTISYYNSAAISSSSPTSSSSDSFVRSPPPPAIPELSMAMMQSSEGLRRSTSLPKRSRTAIGLDPRSSSSDFVIPEQTPTPTPPPQTLVEKHADLLSFIAKKESKCMELREQLAQHESELATLKRKWERIVSRSTSTTLGGAVSSDPDRSPSPGGRLTPLPAVNGTEGVSDMVGAIRDGVTGLGRMLVMGGLASPSASSLSSPSPLSAKSQRSLHGASGRRQASFSVLESTSRTSSVSSITVTSPPRSTTSTGRTSLSSVTSLASSDAEQEEVNVKVPIDDSSIGDGGHTPTLEAHSPSAQDRDVSPNVSSITSSPATSVSQLDDVQPTKPLSHGRDRASKTLGFSSPARRSLNLADRLSEKMPSRLTSPPPSNSPTSWVPSSLNKKWEGLQKSETFTKSSKRASILFSDVTSASTSLLGSLTGALGPVSSGPSTPAAKEQNPQSPARYFPLVTLDSPVREGRGERPPSILDEEDDETINFSGGLAPLDTGKLLSPVLIPSKPSSSSTPSPKVETTSADDDDDWNW